MRARRSDERRVIGLRGVRRIGCDLGSDDCVLRFLYLGLGWEQGGQRQENRGKK